MTFAFTAMTLNKPAREDECKEQMVVGGVLMSWNDKSQQCVLQIVKSLNHSSPTNLGS
jgi:hypothetical protein